MTLEQIVALATSGESETLEFKATTGTRREAAMTVCAFLNQGGGQVLFGVAPDRVVAGQQVSERTIEELSAELRQIDPPAFPTVEQVPVDGDREVVVVSTGQGASRPYSYRGTAYCRVGNTTLAMSADEHSRMLFERMHSEQRWENQPLDGWSVDDLEEAEIRRMEFLDNRQFNGNAFTLLANAERFLRDTLPIAGRFEEDRFERIDEPLYPPLATREALANALCHRDYSIGGGSVGVAVYDDRLEVTSSGSLHFGLTPESLFAPHESRPWNPLIARTFYRRGIIEEWGSGPLKMAELTSAAGLPAPEIEDDGGGVTVRFRRGQSVPRRRRHAASPAERREEVLALLDGAEDGLTRREIHARLGSGVSDRQVRRALEELKDVGLAVSPGRGRSGRWRSTEKTVMDLLGPHGAFWGRFRGVLGARSLPPWVPLPANASCEGHWRS